VELYDLLLDGVFGHQPVDGHGVPLADGFPETRTHLAAMTP
jgi:hypothetical protein